jgi:hypothetical protein
VGKAFSMEIGFGFWVIGKFAAGKVFVYEFEHTLSPESSSSDSMSVISLPGRSLLRTYSWKFPEEVEI